MNTYIGPEVLNATPGNYVMGWLNYSTDVAGNPIPEHSPIIWNGVVTWKSIKNTVTKRSLYHVFVGPLPTTRGEVMQPSPSSKR